MARTYGIPYQLLKDRLRHNWDIERALTSPLCINKGRECQDHLGNRYSSIAAMARAYGIDAGSLVNRLTQYGWDTERALTTPVLPNRKAEQKKCRDHKGKEYPSKAAMSKAYGIPPNVFYNRIAQGQSLKKALTTPLHTNSCKDHNGKEYPSMKDMAEAYGISYKQLTGRIKKGWDLEKALTVPVGCGPDGRRIEYRDHTGKVYPTKTAMAKAYGISDKLLYVRLIEGWDLESALTTPVGQGRPVNPEKYKDHKGNGFPSLKAMAEAHGIPYRILTRRLAAGFSMEEALTPPVPGKRIKRKSGR